MRMPKPILSTLVATLFPSTTGGTATTLASSSSESDLTTYDLSLFDRVVCNLYPFERSRCRPYQGCLTGMVPRHHGSAKSFPASTLQRLSSIIPLQVWV